MSARWEGKALREPITADQPCGQNLEDTQLLASFDAFRLFGQQTPLAPPPEWGDFFQVPGVVMADLTAPSPTCG